MKRQFLRSLGGCLLACAVALPLASCSKNKEQKAEIETLRQELRDRDTNIETIQSQSQELSRKNSELSAKTNEAEQKALQLESQLAQYKSDLESLRGAKANEAAQTSIQTPSQVLESAKTQLVKQLAAVLLIEGDVTSGRGSLIQADGKTWLYSTPQVFSGNSKFTIKGADGTALTKIGGFQMAADANLARVEIQQEMPTKFEFDAKASVDTTTPLVTVSAGSNGEAPQESDCRIARTVGNDFELTINTIPASYGCPLLSAQSGKVIAILGSGAAETAPTLWPNTQQAPVSDPITRAARINRTIEWKPATIAAFLAERHKIDDINKTSRLLFAMAAVKVVGTSLQLNAALGSGGATVLKVLEQNAALPMVAELMKIQTDLDVKKMGIATNDIKRRLSSILSQAKTASARQIQEVKGSAFSSFHRPAAELALKWRAEAEQATTAALDIIGR